MKKILKGVIIILAILFTIAFLGQILIYDTPRESEIASYTKLRKAIAEYENIIKTYKEENKTKKITDLVENNCQNISNYFIIKQQNGCFFETTDGLQWQFHENGSATATTKYKSITMGICNDGTINCPQEYPEVEEVETFLNNFSNR